MYNLYIDIVINIDIIYNFYIDIINNIVKIIL